MKPERRIVRPVSVTVSSEIRRPGALLILLFSLSYAAPLAASEKPLFAAASGLQFALREGLDSGETVTWCIPSDGIVVHRLNRPSRGEHENPVFGVVAEMFRFGQMTEITLEVDDPDGHPLHCSVPTHAAARNDIVGGAVLGVSLKADMIHIMD